MGCGSPTGAAVGPFADAPHGPTTGDATSVPEDGASPRDATLVVDSPPDAPPQWVTIETFSVPCVDQARTSATVLQAGVTYRLHASGQCIVNTLNGSLSDAEFIGYNLGPPYDGAAGVDNGIAIDDLTLGSTKQPRWGMYAANHEYEVSWVGAGAKISASYHDSNDSNNSGALMLAILALQ